MSKILFIENRFRTIFWEKMAEKLCKDGHSIYWIIQNHSFIPLIGDKRVIPYPPKKDLEEILIDSDKILISSDRNINYFKHENVGYYFYYRKYIESILTEIQPDIVFGESTAFHELITIDLCKKYGILYLQPSTSRFPIGRFSFYKYDTLEPFGGSGDILNEKEATDVILGITKRSILPDYMHKNPMTWDTHIKRFKDLFRLTKEYYYGEHYNTPNPFVKYQIERQKNKNKKKWDILCDEKSIIKKENTFKVLYPLQMQPEANIDIWGRSYRQQLETIMKINDNIPDDVLIIIKPNPKSKYELTEDLINYIRSNKRIIPLRYSITMAETLPLVDLVITVTGTIAIECILSNIPVLTLVETINNKARNCIFLENFLELNYYINCTKGRNFVKINDLKKIEFINLLNSTSFSGLPYESYLNSENIKKCYQAFSNILIYALDTNIQKE